MNITVEKLETEIHSGDWHDKPMRWTVKGPGAEVQNFVTKKNAEAYRRIRRKSATFNDAVSAYVGWAVK